MYTQTMLVLTPRDIVSREPLANTPAQHIVNTLVSEAIEKLREVDYDIYQGRGFQTVLKNRHNSHPIWPALKQETQ